MKSNTLSALFRSNYGSKRGMHSSTHQWWRSSVEEKVTKVMNHQSSASFSIYKVPRNIFEGEPEAYTPSTISIGPYHHGGSSFQQMEDLKWTFFERLKNTVHFKPLVDAVEESEDEARAHYADQFDLTRDEFLKMLLLDGCFIIELLKELNKYNFKHGSPLLERWMLPALCHDLIKLENQFPLSVLQKLFRLTVRDSPAASLELLALNFFSPLLVRDMKSVKAICSSAALNQLRRKHFLDLFRASILPKAATEAETQIKAGITPARDDQMDSIWSTRELKMAKMIIERGKNYSVPLDVHSEGRALIIPAIYLDDYKGTLFRNLVAYEQRHHECKPQVTSYLSFLDGLIDSVRDVEILRSKHIIQHSLGSNEDVAELINNICKEVAKDTKDSYLQKVLWDANFYMNSAVAKLVVPLVNKHFKYSMLSVSTLKTIKAFLIFFK